jgi:hypothetical protein
MVVGHAGENGWWNGKSFQTNAGTKGVILGMYTCRLSADDGGTKAVSDLGLVWKQHILYEILNASAPLIYLSEA